MNKLFSTLLSTLFAIKDFQMQQTYQKKSPGANRDTFTQKKKENSTKSNIFVSSF